MSSLFDRRATSNGPGGDNSIDVRQALFNDGAIGPAAMIQVPVERITSLNGIMLDLDPKLLKPDNPIFPPADDPREFLDRIAPVLDRHPLLKDAEVRSSGRGLHPILWLGPPLGLTSAAEQKRWATLVRIVQRSLPGDPNAPGITALTRPVGSVNAKNGALVEILRAGQPVSPALVEAFVSEMAAAPFLTVAKILLGSSERVEPCPICLRPGSSLGVQERGGTCYGCNKVTLEMVYNAAYRDDSEGSGESDDQATPRQHKAAPKRKANVPAP